MLNKIEKKHIAAFAVGSFVGQVVSLAVIGRIHDRRIKTRDLIIGDLTTLATNLSAALRERDPETHQKIFDDVRFEQIVRGSNIYEAEDA